MLTFGTYTDLHQKNLSFYESDTLLISLDIEEGPVEFFCANFFLAQMLGLYECIIG